MQGILLIGYRRTGKDTLCKQLSDPEYTPKITDIWRIYRAPNSTQQFPIPSRSICRVALADALKKDVLTSLNMVNANLEDLKDQPLLPDGSTFRDLCIAHGARKRAEDIDYWCRTALANYTALNRSSDTALCITDIRFPNEIQFFSHNFFTSIVTIRVYRSAVPIPPVNEPSERSLDKYLTDFILCASGDEEKMKATFPQYKDYIQV